MLPAITTEDLPALHDAASTASLEAQATYLRLVRWDLAALVVGSLVTAASFQKIEIVKWGAALGALLLVGGLIITVVISHNNYEQRWYGGRAVAESVKTLSWRYATGAEPFSVTLSESEADARFVEQLQAILQQSEYLAVQLGGIGGTKEQISAAMRDLRQASLEERKAVYLRDRIKEQRAWYSSRAQQNDRGERKLFAAVIAVQLLAVATALVLVARPGSSLNISGVAATVAAALLAWLQVKRHQELSQSYSIAAHELGLIAEQSRHVASEPEFTRFVGDAEAAVSREHTLWVARRDVPGTRRRIAAP